MTSQTDLFGQETGQPSSRPDLDIVRHRLRSILEKARTADKMPWPERDARIWQSVFPSMLKLLPDDEANQLHFEFIQEIERLMKAA